eukprot:215233_1
MSTVALLLVTFVFTVYGEVITCDEHSEFCGCDSSISGQICHLDCADDDRCKDTTLQCRPGDPCIINCNAEGACSGNTNIFGFGATDVTVVCGDDESCKGNTEIYCGTGFCLIICSDEDSCEDTVIDPALASAFLCLPEANCQYAESDTTAFGAMFNSDSRSASADSASPDGASFDELSVSANIGSRSASRGSASADGAWLLSSTSGTYGSASADAPNSQSAEQSSELGLEFIDLPDIETDAMQVQDTDESNKAKANPRTYIIVLEVVGILALIVLIGIGFGAAFSKTHTDYQKQEDNKASIDTEMTDYGTL